MGNQTTKEGRIMEDTPTHVSTSKGHRQHRPVTTKQARDYLNRLMAGELPNDVDLTANYIREPWRSHR